MSSKPLSFKSHLTPLSGFHSPSIAPALPPLKAWLDKHEASFNVLEKLFFSTFCGKEIAKHEHLRLDYWVSLVLCDISTFLTEL